MLVVLNDDDNDAADADDDDDDDDNRNRLTYPPFGKLNPDITPRPSIVTFSEVDAALKDPYTIAPPAM